MIKILLISLLLMTASMTHAGEAQLKIESSSIATGKVQIIGQLGVPLGDVCRVEGVFFDGSDLRIKAYDGIILLKVIKVNNTAIKNSVILRFSEFQKGILHDSKIGKKFVGVAFETGKYVGVPPEAWNYVPIISTTSHFFETSLVILKEITEQDTAS